MYSCYIYTVLYIHETCVICTSSSLTLIKWQILLTFNYIWMPVKQTWAQRISIINVSIYILLNKEELYFHKCVFWSIKPKIKVKEAIQGHKMRNSTKYRSGMCMRTRFLSVPWKFTASKTDDERAQESNIQRMRGSRSADVRTDIYRSEDEHGCPFVSETSKTLAVKSVSLDSGTLLGVPSRDVNMKSRSQSDSDVIDGNSHTSNTRRKRRTIATFINRVRIGGRRSTVSCMTSRPTLCEDFKIHVPKFNKQNADDVFYPQNPAVIFRLSSPSLCAVNRVVYLLSLCLLNQYFNFALTYILPLKLFYDI